MPISDKKECYLCGSLNNTVIHYGVRDDSSINVLRCNECGLVFLDSFIENVDEFYSSSGMRDYQFGTIEQIRIDAMEDDERRLRFLMPSIKNRVFLDFGCGGGGLLRGAASLARKTVGIEIEKTAREMLRREGLDVFSSIDEAFESLDVKVDVISLFHVLEHLQEPVLILKKIAKLLNPQGKIVIEVPNADDALISLYENKSFCDFTYWKCHLFLFNNYTLRQVIEKSGLKVEFMTQIMRYPLANHLYWMSKGKVGGHFQWNMLRDLELDRAYEKRLASLGIADTILVEARIS